MRTRRQDSGRAGLYSHATALGMAVAFLCAILSSRLPAQGWRVAAWASYEDVTNSDDWTAWGAQITWVTARGHGLWGSVELVDRFGIRDGTEKIGGVLHPTPRLWLTLEAGTAARPEVVPKNSWDVDASVLLRRGLAAGLGYRRQNYAAGPVDLVIPHVTAEAGGVSWDARVFVARNPARRTDAAVLLRAARVVSGRAVVWAGVAAGRESYLVATGTAQEVRSLRTVTGTVGGQYAATERLSLRLDATLVSSDPILSRRGIAVRIETRF